MNTFFIPLLLGAPQQTGAEAGGAGGAISTFIPLLLVIFIFYFLMIRPQNKKRKEAEKMLAALKKGDKVVTIGGLHGTIQSVKETTVIIKADDNVKLEFLRSAISNVVTAAKEKDDAIEDKTEEKDGSSEAGE